MLSSMQKWYNAIGQSILLIGIIHLQACLGKDLDVDEGDGSSPAKKEKPVEPGPSGPTLDQLIKLTNDLIQERKNNNEPVDALEPTLPNVLGALKQGTLGINDKFDESGNKRINNNASSWSTLLTFVAECPQLSESLQLQYLQYAKAQGGDFKVLSSWGASLLHMFVIYHDPDSLQWALENTAAKEMINKKDNASETPLEMAVAHAVSAEQSTSGKLQKSLQVLEILLLQNPSQPIDFKRKVQSAESTVGAATQTRALLRKHGKL